MDKLKLHSSKMTSTKTLLRLFIAEFIGTALLLNLGLNVVIFIWGTGSVVPELIPSIDMRRVITGFLFGGAACLVILSPVGRISGAHINPAVSVAFWLRGKMKTHAMIGYVASQLLGALVGCLPLLLWSSKGESVDYGNTMPGNTGLVPAFIGEMITTALLIFTLFTFIGNRRLRHYTPYTLPFLYAFMVWAEGEYSGCSTNPARSFGPAAISGNFGAHWLYWIAPLIGALLTVLIIRTLRLHHYHQIEAARISFHDHHSPDVLKN